MKRYVYIITACILCLSSCKGFLEENPKDAINENQIVGNLKELYMHSVATLYNNIGGYNDSEGIQGTGRGIYDLNTFTTDEAIMPTRGADWYDGGFWQGLYLHDWGTNNNSILATWEYLYKSVMLCNESARRIKDYATEHSDDDAQPLMSEVRALRALFYYHLMDLFGRVPLIRETEVEKSVKEQAERSEIFWLIVNELQESLPYLADERSNIPGEYYGRITRHVAYFVLRTNYTTCGIFFVG